MGFFLLQQLIMMIQSTHCMACLHTFIKVLQKSLTIKTWIALKSKKWSIQGLISSFSESKLMNLCWYVQSCLSSTWFKCTGRGTSHNIWGKLLLITAKKDGKGNCISGDYLLPFWFCFLACPHYWAIHVLWEYIGNEHLLGGFLLFLFSSTKCDWLLRCVWSLVAVHLFIEALAGEFEEWRSWSLVRGSWQWSLCCCCVADRKLHKALRKITSKFLLNMGVATIPSLLLEKELSGEGKESSATFIGVN